MERKVIILTKLRGKGAFLAEIQMDTGQNVGYYNLWKMTDENGESEINGQQWLNYAIGSYVQSGEANGFTRDFNARFHIQSHVTPENAKQAIAQKLGANVSDLNPSYGSLVTLCKEYAKAIADESFIRN